MGNALVTKLLGPNRKRKKYTRPVIVIKNKPNVARFKTYYSTRKKYYNRRRRNPYRKAWYRDYKKPFPYRYGNWGITATAPPMDIEEQEELDNLDLQQGLEQNINAIQEQIAANQVIYNAAIFPEQIDTIINEHRERQYNLPAEAEQQLVLHVPGSNKRHRRFHYVDDDEETH